MKECLLQEIVLKNKDFLNFRIKGSYSPLNLS